MQPVLTPTRPCNLCGAAEATVVSERSRSGAYLRSVACTACGLVWSDPRPHAVRAYYEDDYRRQYKGTFVPRPKHVLRAGLVALDRLDKVRPFLKPASRVLDVGSGGGEFAYLLKTLGHHVVGVEPNRGYGEFSRSQYGLDVQQGFIGDVQLPAGGFDLITIWHVLEHTEDPAAVLRQLRAALRPGGRLVVEVPNVLATCQSPRSSFHEAHLYTFSPATLQRLGAREGLQQQHLQVSADGGNLTIAFATTQTPVVDAAQLRQPGHARDVVDTVRRHTPWSHALSAHPWRRAATRLRRAVAEAWHTRNAGSAREMLDALYAHNRAPANGRGTSWAPWGWLLAAYGGAVAAEEVLVDQAVSSVQIGAPAGMAAYMGLQLVVIAVLFWTLRRRLDSRRNLLKASAWVVPLFAVPAVC